MRRTLLKISRALFDWPPTPPSVAEKHAFVTRMGLEAGIRNFIETGTFQGNMTEAQREHFTTIATIELSDELHAAAQKRFAPYPHIHVLHGDSGRMLGEALRLMDGPVLYWLDAHYSKGITARGDEEAPILVELATIAARHQPGDLILIDDARLFGLHPGYPTLGKIRKVMERAWPGTTVHVESDAICIATPKA